MRKALKVGIIAITLSLIAISLFLALKPSNSVNSQLNKTELNESVTETQTETNTTISDNGKVDFNVSVDVKLSLDVDFKNVVSTLPENQRILLTNKGKDALSEGLNWHLSVLANSTEFTKEGLTPLVKPYETVLLTRLDIQGTPNTTFKLTLTISELNLTIEKIIQTNP